ncbi:MAG: hypothetical protein KGI50_00330 [Patescibacteria group bacterium]|nr:hypothetical protein [Patescibacteria group bacterium]MDE2438194.1 hypothetical protein [Patescibacteria group bacterium]
MNDLVGTIKRLRHIRPHKGYYAFSKKKLLRAITPPVTFLAPRMLVSLALGTSGIIALSLLLFHPIVIAPAPATLSSLDHNALIQEFDNINLAAKIKETKKQDSNNKVIDRTIQNLAFAKMSSAPSSPTSGPHTPTVNTILDELL